MSLPSLITQRRVKKTTLFVLGLSGVLFMASMFAQPSGAYFFDQKQIVLDGSAGSLGLSMTRDGDVGTNGSFHYYAVNIVPGYDQKNNYSVTNTGTLPGTLKVSLSRQLGGGTPTNPGLLSEKITDSSSQGAAQTITSTPLDFGTLNPGQTKTFAYEASLDSSAGNDWQHVSFVDTVNVTLAQVQP